MKMPTVKSCGCFDLRTVGLMIGFLQVFLYGLAVLLEIINGIFLVIPISLTALMMNILWIYGIQEKKVILMLPSLILPVLVSLVGLAVITTLPVYIAVMTFYPKSDYYRYHEQRFHDTGIALGVWFAGCFVTAFFSYVTIVQYSLCKSLEESHRNKSRLPSAPMQDIPLNY